MKIKFKHIALFILAVFIIAGGVLFISQKKIIAHIIPSVEQIGDINIKIKIDSLYINTKFIITNKTFLKIKIKTLKYEIALLEKTYLKSHKFIGATLPAYGSDTIDFSLKIPFMDVINDLKVQREKSDSIDYTINIYLQFSTIFGKWTIPINKSAKIKIPQPPEIEIVKIKYKKLNLKSILADAELKIINKGNVTFAIKNMNYLISFSNHGKIDGCFNELVHIKPMDTTYVSIPFEINPKSIGKTIFDLLFNKDNFDYTITLNALLESPAPLNESFKISISKSGKMELRK